ncbi:DUF177 domain-containing protein [Halalkalibacter sp. APA_J-10(15)]|uniref:YceD family protein n=1 Tax=unclassified Halalkalibacter TaxID=2893063 RepID=UPI001FF3C01E|nr:DUF177 domain-containing protein [Halalkalibacter sp. APA_J-10(15)]MCK0470647.1 DUF177 domain-containing protein [Halalkalibacter sp. APA_J-10(15)]
MLKWSLQQLNVAKHKPFTFEETIDLSSVMNINKEIRNVSPFNVKGELLYRGSLLTFTLQISGSLILPCSRTLADVTFPIDIEVVRQYHPKNDYVTADVDHDDIQFFEGEMVDLKPAIEEAVLLEIPMQLFADEKSVPLAPPEGKHWELVTDEKKEDRIDPRLADLAKFFDKE